MRSSSSVARVSIFPALLVTKLDNLSTRILHPDRKLSMDDGL